MFYFICGACGCGSEEVKVLYNKEPTSFHLEIKVATCGALDFSHRDQAPKSLRESGCPRAIPFPVSEHCTERTLTRVSALHFPLPVNSLLLFNRIIVNVFNFVIIYESRSTSFSMKRKNQQNPIEKECVCVIIIFFLPKKKENKAKKKSCLHCQCFGASKTVLVCSRTVKLHFFTGTAEEQW